MLIRGPVAERSPVLGADVEGSSVKSLKFIEPGAKAIYFADRKWKIWHTDKTGRPTHSSMIGDKIPLLTVHQTSKSEYLVIIAGESIRVSDPMIQIAVDKAVGLLPSTLIHIETADDKCECDYASYQKRIGREDGGCTGIG